MENLKDQKSIYFIPVAIILAGIVIAGAVIYTGNQSASVSEIVEDVVSGEKKEVVSGEKIEGQIRGNKDALITIVEYSDFQCPFCERFHSTVKQILKDYPDVNWIYKHFPLDSIHAQARPAAEASECATEQGMFWEFADSLFDNQSRLDDALYVEIASQLGLDISQFNECVSSRKYRDKVEADYQEGIKAGVTGTPGSFINGEKIPGAVPYDYLKDIIERILAN